MTGLQELRPELAGRMKDGRLDYFANGEVSFSVRGAHARVKVLWNYEAPAGAGDTHIGIVRGSLSRIEVLQGPEQKWRPELYVVPNRPADATAVRAALASRSRRSRRRARASRCSTRERGCASWCPTATAWATRRTSRR